MFKDFLRKIKFNLPPLYLLVQILQNRVGSARGSLESIHQQFAKNQSPSSSALDIGCGLKPKHLFQAKTVYGIDLHEDLDRNIYKVRLGYETLPFDDNSFDYITAYDLLEHIPRYGNTPDETNSPFIFLMNEIYRILKKDGLFLSFTPVYPYLAAFQDPTHNNIMTVDTLMLYFTNQKYSIAEHYGIKCDYEMLYRKMHGQHLIAILEK